MNSGLGMKTVEVVAAIIVRDGRVFATQRGYGAWKDWWEFPGGKMEPGESPEAALVREIREELSACIVVDRFLTTVEWDYPEFHLKMHCYLCSLGGPGSGSGSGSAADSAAGSGAEGGSELHLNEHEASRWLSVAAPDSAPDSLSSVRWLPADLSLLPLIQAALD